MPKKSAKRKPASDVLKISIHGHGIDIDAIIEGSRGGSSFTSFIEAITKQIRPAAAPAPAAEPDPVRDAVHDFDVVLRVIKIADVETLQTIVTLANAELAVRPAS